MKQNQICGIVISLILIAALAPIASAACCSDATKLIVPEGRYLTVDTYGNMMFAFFPPDAQAPFGRFADGTPIPDGYLNPAQPHVTQPFGTDPLWEKHTAATRARNPAAGRGSGSRVARR